MRRADGLVTAEFSLVLVLFLTITFGVLEVGRAMYMFNVLHMVTQRAATAAANADFSDPDAMAAVRRYAVMRSTSGALIMGAPITDDHVRIDYLKLAGPAGSVITPIAAGGMPVCPVNNRVACMQDPNGAACIRLVRARICDPADTGTCRHTAYRSMFPLVRLPVQLPLAAAVAGAETLGALPGDGPCQ